jgi:diaminopimelate epimerase
MRFTKMHGIGNDYIYVDTLQETVADPQKLAVRIADRHFGVGGDGLILIAPPSADGRRQGAHVRMRMFNADGSESEMCGNGVRCVAKYAYDHQLATVNPIRVETGRGVLTLDLWLQHGRVHQVTVNMGRPILDPRQIPVLIPRLDAAVDYPAAELLAAADPVAGRGWTNAGGVEDRMTCVSLGNPHVVLYARRVESIPLETVGPVLERHAWFPRRINVHFVQVLGAGEVKMRTWERGSGITLGCGTGAAAVCVAGVLTGRTQPIILAHLPGGRLALKWSQEDKCVYMTGPAEEVFSGDWPVPDEAGTSSSTAEFRQ